MFDFRDLTERYGRDASFRALVNSMHGLIRNEGFTPDELRQALFMACYKYELESARPIHITMNQYDTFTRLDRNLKDCGIAIETILIEKPKREDE